MIRQEQRRALQKLEQRASDLENQLSDALVDVQRRDSTIFELKAALQVRFLLIAMAFLTSWQFVSPSTVFCLKILQAKGAELNIAGASPVKARAAQLSSHASTAIVRNQ